MRARIVVAAATVRMGIARTLMQRAGRRSEDEPGVGLLRQFTWPDLVVASIKGEIEVEGEVKLVSDLTFEEWLELPEALVISWEKLVYELNPHWLPAKSGKVRSDSGTKGTISAVASSSGTGNG